MRCYRCESEELILAPLWPAERMTYSLGGIVMRQCQQCGLEQNHCGDDELLEPDVAALEAPAHE